MKDTKDTIKFVDCPSCGAPLKVVVEHFGHPVTKTECYNCKKIIETVIYLG
jgi:ribosomal protein S27E